MARPLRIEFPGAVYYVTARGEWLRRATRRYADLVASTPDGRLWDTALRQQIYLGDEDFVERMQALAAPQRTADRDIPKAQRRKARSLAQWLGSCQTREEGLYRAHTESALSRPPSPGNWAFRFPASAG